jgi:hypothetical protein
MNGTPFVIGAIVAILAVGIWNWYGFRRDKAESEKPVNPIWEKATGRKFKNKADFDNYVDDLEDYGLSGRI